MIDALLDIINLEDDTQSSRIVFCGRMMLLNEWSLKSLMTSDVCRIFAFSTSLQMSEDFDHVQNSVIDVMSIVTIATGNGEHKSQIGSNETVNFLRN